MITITNADFKEFFKRSSGIKQTGILPITLFIKIAVMGNNAVISETDDKSVWLTHTVDCVSDKETEILLHKETLQAFVSKSRDATTNILDFIGKITLQDAHQKMNCPTQPADLFSKMPMDSNAERYPVTADLLDNIAIAKHYTTDDPKLRGMNGWEVIYIWSKDKTTHIIGCFSGNYLYYNNFENGGIDLTLNRDSCNMLSGYQEGFFYSINNQVFFDFGKTVIGFTKHEYKRPDFSVILDGLNKKQQCLIDKKDVIDFCELVEALKLTTIYNEVKLKDVDATHIGLFFENKEKERDGDRIIKAEKNFELTTLNFNTKVLLDFFSPLQFEKVNLSMGKQFGMLMVTTPEDEKYIGTVMALSSM